MGEEAACEGVVTMVKPLCPYFGKCGGCTSQDREYSQQLDEKKRALAEAIGSQDIRVFSEKEYYYRNRMDLVFFADGLGFRERGSWHKIVGVERCVISNEKLNALLKEVREFFSGVFYFDVRKRFGTYCFAVIRTPSQDSSVSLVLNQKSKKIPEALEKISEFAEITTARNVVATFVPHNRNVSVSENYEVIKGTDFLREDYLSNTFYFPIQGFFQVNHAVAEKVHIYCRELLSTYPTQGAHLIDLYGGVGTFGIINSQHFQNVEVIENYQPSIIAAQKNIAENTVDNVHTVVIDAKNLKNHTLPSPLFIVLDPPRSGIHPKTLTRLNELNPEVILYISCNPKHLGNDLLTLNSYRLKSAALFDMFPQTPHLEAVVELVKK